MDAVLNWLLQGAVVTAAAFVLLFALRRARANVRYTVCWAVLLLVVALPALPAFPPPQSIAIASGTLEAAAPGAIVSLPDTWWTSALLLAAAWAAWAGVQAVRFLSAIVAIRRARAGGSAFPADVEARLPQWRRLRGEGRRAALIVSPTVGTAAVLGWGTPTIAVAPSLVKSLDPEDLDRVLIHEWAHVQRRDDVANILQIAVRIVAGWHPALWWIDRRLHVERELACDETTVAITGSPKSYAACLVTLADLAGARRTLRAAPGACTPPGLRARVIRLVSSGPSIAPLWSRSLAAAIVLTLSVVSVAVANMTLVEAAAFAQPLLTARTPAATLVQPAAATPRRSAARSPRRTIVPPPSAQRPKTDPLPAPAPPRATNPISAPAAEASKPIEPPSSSDAHAESALPSTPIALVATAPHTAPVPPGTAPTETRSPWAVAASGGAAIGKKSKDAGVATAGFFSRVARRVAGSF